MSMQIWSTFTAVSTESIDPRLILRNNTDHLGVFPKGHAKRDFGTFTVSFLFFFFLVTTPYTSLAFFPPPPQRYRRLSSTVHGFKSLNTDFYTKYQRSKAH